MNYGGWERQDKNITSLFLDPRNPRIPPSPRPLAEAELIQELVLHDDVFDLAKNIAANGFFPSEPLVAVKQEGRAVVVEGNRRLAACKLLSSPQGAPTDFQSKFRALSGTFDQNVLKKLPVIMAPSREATVPLIIARHTSVQVLRWDPPMQAAFYRNLLQSGMSIDDVAAKFNLSAGEIREALRNHNLYQMACSLDLPAEVSELVRNPRKFSLTTLGRIFETPIGRDFFGVDFNADGDLEGRIDPGEFRKGFAKAVRDVATGEADSRTLNAPSDIQKYLDSFARSERPDLSRSGTFDSSTFVAAVGSCPTKTPAKTRRVVKTAVAPTGLIPRSFACNLRNQRVRNLFSELQRLSPEKFPNACALVFRCFLEVSVFCFLDSKGEIGKIQAEARAEVAKKNARLPPSKQKHSLPPHWTPNLGAMLDRLVNPKHNIIPQGHVTKALRKVIQDEQGLFALNLYAHNPTYHPTGPKLRAAWANLEEFFRLILA